MLIFYVCKKYLQKHAFGYNGRADSLITGEHRWGVEGDEEEEIVVKTEEYAAVADETRKRCLTLHQHCASTAPSLSPSLN